MDGKDFKLQSSKILSCDDLVIDGEDFSMLLQSSKILSCNDLATAVKKLRKADSQRKKIIGITCGCFDLLHLGHLYAIKKAKSLCDVLVVCVNKDRSVRFLKGDARPVQNEQTRSLIIASLMYVDYVMLFDESMTMQVVEAVQPDVVIKDKYKSHKWPEPNNVSWIGAKTIRLDKIPDQSTTNIIKKIIIYNKVFG